MNEPMLKAAPCPLSAAEFFDRVRTRLDFNVPPSLLDPNVVKPGYTPDPTKVQEPANFEAALYANLNLMMDAPLTYPNPAPVFVVFGNVADPTDYNSPFGPNDSQNPCNTLVVTVERSRRNRRRWPRKRLACSIGAWPWSDRRRSCRPTWRSAARPCCASRPGRIRRSRTRPTRR